MLGSASSCRNHSLCFVDWAQGISLKTRLTAEATLIEVIAVNSRTGQKAGKTRCRISPGISLGTTGQPPADSSAESCCCSSTAHTQGLTCTCRSCGRQAQKSCASRAEQRLLSRVRQATDEYRAGDCTVFDTLIGCELQVRPCLQSMLGKSSWQLHCRKNQLIRVECKRTWRLALMTIRAAC